MRQSHKLKRHSRQNISAWRAGVLAFFFAVFLPGQTFAADGEVCNSYLSWWLTGPQGANWFVDDEITVNATLTAGNIGSPGTTEFLQIPSFGFAGDCTTLSGLTWGNCVEANSVAIEYLGDPTSANCKDDSGQNILFQLPESNTITFSPIKPIHLTENSSCEVAWKFKVAQINSDATNVKLNQVAAFAAGASPATCVVPNGDLWKAIGTTSSGNNGYLNIDTCGIEVKKEVCDASASDCTNNADWKNANNENNRLVLSKGGTAVYRAVIENTGSVPYVGNISVDDDDLNIHTTIPLLAAGATATVGFGGLGVEDDWAYKCSSKTNFKNQVKVAASCRGGEIPVSADDQDNAWAGCDNYEEPEAKLILKKTATPSTYDAVDDQISYSYVLTNDGDVNLYPPYSVDDDKIVGPNTVTCDQTPDPMEPGDMVNCSAIYKITQADLEAGSVKNIARGTAKDQEGGGSDVLSNYDDETVTAEQKRDLTLKKTATPLTYDAVDDEISYSYVLTNDGNVNLYPPYSVDDDKIVGPNTVTCDQTPDPMEPGDTVNCSATYKITQADLEAGSVKNIARGTAKDKETGGSDVLSNYDDETVTAITITLEAAPVCTNDVPWASYTVEVKGKDGAVPGDVTFSWVNVDDPNNEVVIEGPTALTAWTGHLLWPGATATTNDPNTAVGTGWPGWVESPAGVWTFTDTDEVPQLMLRFEVNPMAEELLDYPPATPRCTPGPKPVINLTKSVENVTEVDDFTLDVTYRVNVSNTGGQPIWDYDLKDYLKVDEALMVEDPNADVTVSYVAGNDSLNGTLGTPKAGDFETPTGGVLVTTEKLEAGKNESFEFTLRFMIDGTETTLAGANCKTDDDGDGKTGLTNHVDLLIDDEIEKSAEACDEFPLTPLIDIRKAISIDSGATYEPVSAGPVEPPHGAIYQIEVKNVGNINLSSVTITDSLIVGSYTFGPLGVDDGWVPITTTTGPKPPGDGWSALDVKTVCESTAEITNTATATGVWLGAVDDENVSAIDTAKLICEGDPMIDIAKDVYINGQWYKADTPPPPAYPQAVYDPENPVPAEYRITVTNIGSSDLKDVEVNDSKLFMDITDGNLVNGIYWIGDIPAGDVEGNPVVLLQGDIPQLAVDSICTSIGPNDNVAGVIGTSVDDDSKLDEITNSATVECVGKPDILVEKQVSSTGNSDDWHPVSDTGEPLSDAFFRIIVTNNGDDDLVNVKVSDDFPAGYPDIVNLNIGNLAVNETKTLVHGTANAGEIQNTALQLDEFCDGDFSWQNSATAVGDPVSGGASVQYTDTATFICQEQEQYGELCVNGKKPKWIKIKYDGDADTFIQDSGTHPTINPSGLDNWFVKDDPTAWNFPSGSMDVYIFDNRGGKHKLLSSCPNTPVNGWMIINAGKKVPPTTLVEIYSDCPSYGGSGCSGSLQQKVEFHTSCSQPMTAGDEYGGVTLMSSGNTSPPQPPTCN